MRIWLSLFLVLSAFAAAMPADASGGGGGEKKEKKKEGDGHGDKKGKAPKKDRNYTSLESWVMVDPFTVSIIQEGRVRGRFMVSFGMDVLDEKLRERAETIMPRLRDAWLGELNLYASTTLRVRKPADIATVSDILQGTADAVLGQTGSKVLMGQATVDMTP